MRNKRFLPDFLGIGAQKCGTTWLYANLLCREDIWLPPVKELHYFDCDPSYPSVSYLASKKLVSRLFGNSAVDIAARKFLKTRAKNFLRRADWRKLPWESRFLFGHYDDDWYASLFKEGRDKIKGEITPSYSVLDSKDVKKIQTLMPEVKIIYIIRNPIDRTWSHLRFHNNRLKIKDLQTFTEFENFVNSPSVVLKGNYLRTMEIWRNCFPPKQFFVGFYDDLKMEPEKFLVEILKFLGAESSSKYLKRDFSRRVYASPKQEFPDEFKRYLAQKYYKQIALLSEMLGGHATTWLQQVEKTLHTS
jgi:hypothetical protein